MREVSVCNLFSNHNPEREVFLDKIAKHNNNSRGDNLGNDGINVKILDK
jgi:hypothetical protein